MVSDPATTEASDRCIGAERGSDADSIIACVVLIEVVSLVGGTPEVVVVVVVAVVGVGSNVCVVVLVNSGCWSAGGGVVERVRGGRTGVGNVEVTEEFFWGDVDVDTGSAEDDEFERETEEGAVKWGFIGEDVRVAFSGGIVRDAVVLFI